MGLRWTQREPSPKGEDAGLAAYAPLVNAAAAAPVSCCAPAAPSQARRHAATDVCREGGSQRVGAILDV